MQRALASVDPNLPFSGFYSMRDLLAKTLATQRIEVALLSAMAALALLLSAVGIFALVSNMVAQRTREIGIRMALGAQTSSVERLFLRRGLQLTAAGLAIGLPAAFVIAKLFNSILYGIKPNDAITFISIPLFLAFVALLASYIPARRATKLDPMIALRYE